VTDFVDIFEGPGAEIAYFTGSFFVVGYSEAAAGPEDFL
jgi:hypothetical protein